MSPLPPDHLRSSTACFGHAFDPNQTCDHSDRGGQTHREVFRTRVDKRRALFGYPKLAYRCLTIRGWSRRMYHVLWVKCTTPAGCKSTRVAVSAVRDGWSWFCRAGLCLSEEKVIWKKWRVDGTWSVRTMVDSGYLSTRSWPVEQKLGFPQPDGLSLNSIFKMFCFLNKDTGMSWTSTGENYFWNYVSQQKYRGVVSSTEP